MVYWLLLAIALLLGIATASLLWGIRREALLRRLNKAIGMLLQGREPTPTVRPEDQNEPILSAFDQLASQICDERRAEAQADRGREMELVLERLIAMLRQPLVAVQSYASLIKQAPEIPETGDTHELVQKLTTQITGLLRLFEASTDVGQLRAALSGLEREADAIPPDTSVRPILLVDEENQWSRDLAELIRPLSLQVLLAPGADAAVIMARAVQPRAIVVNLSRPDQLGWRAMPMLRRERRFIDVPIFLVYFDEMMTHGAFWSPTDIWFWPLPNNDDSRIVRQRIKRESVQYSIEGPLVLVTDVARWLASVGINVEAKAGTAPVVLEGGVSLTLRPTDDVADEPSYILIIPQRLVTLEADKLTNSLRDASEARPTPIEEMKKQLFEKLRQLNQPRPKPESP